MRGFVPILKRELFAFFVTPLAWVLITVFLLVQGMHFFLLIEHFSSAPDLGSDQTPMQAFFGKTVLLYLVLFLLIPAMTMRLFAEERRSGTIESLMSTQVTSVGVVAAKFCAALVVYIAMWAPTLLYLVILQRAGEVDWHAAAGAYLGVVAIGAAYIAIGLFMSSLTQSQFLALVLTAMVILAFFILGVGEFVTKEGTLLHAICEHVSAWAHMNSFASGVIDSRAVIFYGSITLLPLFLTTRVVEGWK